MNTLRAGRLTIELPEGYTKKPLPGMNAWVAALRGGEYKQGREMLCYQNTPPAPPSYCCLGVLCEIQGRPKRQGAPRGGVWYDSSNTGLRPQNPVFDELDKEGKFPSEVAVVMPTGQKACCLAEANDAGATFAEIADIIEAVWSDPSPKGPSAEKPPKP